MKLFYKLTGILVIVGLVPLFLGIIVADNLISKRLKEDGLQRLELMQESKFQQIKQWGKEYESSIEFIAGTDIIAFPFQKLKSYHDKLGVTPDASFPVDTEEYNMHWKDISPKLLKAEKHFRVKDLFIICAAHGHIMYSNSKGKDLGSNLVYGEYKDSALAKAWKKAIETKQTAAVDFEPYAPDNNNYNAFIATPFLDQSGKVIGVLAIEVSPAEINMIMQDRAGMGETGEAYLMGKHNGRTSFRSEPLTGGNGKFKLGFEIRTDYIDKALNGENSHGEFIDSLGKNVLVSYSPINVFGLNWAVISRITQKEVMRTAYRLRFVLLVLLGILSLTVFIPSQFIAKGISHPIQEVASVSKFIGDGDLTQQVNVSRGDEIGDLGNSLNRSVKHLSGLIRTVKEASNEILISSDEMATGSADLASRSQQQAASLTETSATVEQFSAAVKLNSRNAEELNSSIMSFRDMLMENKNLVEDVSTTMEKIDESGKRIDAIVSVINDISFQTNLLSLNAAIEAARAGEAGKGFSVVASEVRSLAQKTAESSKTIQDIIGQNVESTQQGMKLVGRTNDSIGRIVKVMAGLSDKITHISNASNEQSAGIEQINTAVAQLEEVVNQNASLGEEFSASSESLRQSAGQLQLLVGQFKVETVE